MTVIKEYIKSEDVINFLKSHIKTKNDFEKLTTTEYNKNKFINTLIDEFIDKIIIEKIGEDYEQIKRNEN
ncbi:MAG: hypothetical protein SPJ27_07565 [Candidatus Onthovivens sp.]|nr:hypothetical protein [Candidatus Onthovivens sp.]